MTYFAKNEIKLDDFDRQILNLIQGNADRTHAEIGAEIGLSSSAVRRRIRLLKESELIESQIVILDADELGVTIIVDVSFENETPKIYSDFEEQMIAIDVVQQCYHVAGDTDFILVVHCPNLQWYEQWSKDKLMTNVNIRRYSSRVVWARKKFSPMVKL